MIFQIDIPEDSEEFAELEDIVNTYNKEHPEGPTWTKHTWIGRQIFIPLQERIDQQYVGLARLMSKEEKQQTFGKIKDVKAKLKKKVK